MGGGLGGGGDGGAQYVDVHTSLRFIAQPVFRHGDESHSSTSTSQLPLNDEFAALFGTVHAAVYSVM